MKIIYSLRIYTESKNYEEISSLLKIDNCSKEDFGFWSYEIIDDEENDMNYNFIEHLELLFGDKLIYFRNKEKYNLQLWILYEYNQQCNLEFDLIELEILSKRGINLAISCWEG